MAHYLIIGNGVAGVSAAEAIRRRDAEGRITLVSAEPYRLYSRPGIAYLLTGQINEAQIFARSETFYQEHRFDVLYARVTQLDLAARSATLNTGQVLAYDAVLLATGSRAVAGQFPGADLDGVLTFDNLADANKAVAYSRKARTAVVVGGGITAMELAEGLRHQGVAVHWLQRQDRLWPKLFTEHESALLAKQVQHSGVRVHYQEEIAEALGRGGRVQSVRLRGGKTVQCELIGVAIGVKPDIALVKGTDVRCEQGVLVDAHMQSSVAGLFAAGDVAQVLDRWTGKPQLDVLWPSAINTGRVAGYNMVDVAHGRAPSWPYHKTSPFNAALLFGLHLTVIGRVGEGGRANETPEEAAYLSRGASQVWHAPFGAAARSAWDHHGPNSARVLIVEGRLVGALLLGNQQLADPLRALIEGETALTADEQALIVQDLPRGVQAVWRRVQGEARVII